MGVSQPSDQLMPTIRDGIREMVRDFRSELLPRIPPAAVLWGIALGATFVIPGAYDLLSATSGFRFWSSPAGNPHAATSAWFAMAAFAICFGAGFQEAWRSRDFGHGGVVALVTILIGFCVAVSGDVAAVLLIATFRNFDLAGALYGAIEVPLPVMLIVGGTIGALGAAIATALTMFRQTPVTQS